MKNQPTLFILIQVLAVIAFGQLSGCSGGGGDPEPVVTQAEEVSKILTSSTWKLNTVSVDGSDQTNVYKGLTLNFSSTLITSSNGGLVWPASSTWKFTDETATTIDRGDGIKVGISEAKSGKLLLVLTWSKTTLGSGRVSSVKGQHTFSFGN